MDTPFLPERSVFAPDFPPGEWLNTPGLKLAALRGHIVLVYFWDDTSLAALQIIAKLRALEHRYAAHNLVYVGVYTPAFSFARETQQVVQALQKYHITHPTLLDHDHQLARAYRVPSLPCVALIDPQGSLRAQTGHELLILERKLRTLLREIDAAASMPPLAQPAKRDGLPAQPGNASARELRVGMRWGALGNPEGYAADAPILYRLPSRRSPGRFYLEGAWRAGEEHLAFAGRAEGTIRLPHKALEVYAVLSPRHSLIDRLLDTEPVAVEVWQDDRPLADDQRGDDLTEDGRVFIDRPRLYHLVHNPDYALHELTLRVRSAGFSAYLLSLWGASDREDI